MNLKSYKQRVSLVKKIIFWSIIFGAILALFFSSTMARAATPVNVCQEITGCLPGVENNSETGADGVVKFTMQVVWFLIFVGTAIAVLFSVLGGVRMIASNGNEESYKNGLKTLQNAVIGLALAIVSMTIVYLVSSIVPTLDIFG